MIKYCLVNRPHAQAKNSYFLNVLPGFYIILKLSIIYKRNFWGSYKVCPCVLDKNCQRALI